MTEMRTEDEIAELFRSVNPVPNRAVPPRAHDTTPTLVPGGDRPGATVESTPVDMAPDPPQAVPTARRPRERWGLVTLVAASVALVVSLVVVANRDTSDPIPADQPASTTLAASNDVAVVESFVDAQNSHDPSAMAAVLAPDATIDAVQRISVDELPDLVTWYEAWEWQWDPASCAEGDEDGTVWCDVEEQNRLTALTGAERSARVRFRLDDGVVDDVTVIADFSGYRMEFLAFRAWVIENHPGDVDEMWVGTDPILGAETAVLFDRRLSEYEDLYPIDDEPT